MFPHSPVINITQNANIFVKTKNAQEAVMSFFDSEFTVVSFLPNCEFCGVL